MPAFKPLPAAASRIAALLGAIALAAFALSCDDFASLEGGPAPPEGPAAPSAVDLKCLSMTGTRFEKYYWHLDPESYAGSVTLSSPSVLGYERADGAGPASYGFNRATLLGVPLLCFADNAPFAHRVSGTVAVRGMSEDGLAVAYSMPFEKNSDALSPHRDYNSMEPLNVLNSFANTPGDLALAYTGDYSSPAKKEDFRTFSMAFSAGFFQSCVSEGKFSVGETEFEVDRIYPCDLTATGSAYVSMVPVKRNFYQYRSLVASFSPGTFIDGVKPAAIVKGWESVEKPPSCLPIRVL